jgi:hypothetical protein
MPDAGLSQTEADALLAMAKHWQSDIPWSYPKPSKRISLLLSSDDGREEFILDVWRAGIRLTKGSYQNRSRNVLILARIDIDGAPHRNPDDSEVPGTHLHVYREGFGDKWAFALPADRFPPPHDLRALIMPFCAFCSIVTPPTIQESFV